MNRSTSRKGSVGSQRPCGLQCCVNTVQASKDRGGGRPAIITGKAVVWGRSERFKAPDPTGVVVAARMEGAQRNEGSLSGWATGMAPVVQRAAREGSARFRQMTDGGVVPGKPGNAGGGKAP